MRNHFKYISCKPHAVRFCTIPIFVCLFFSACTNTGDGVKKGLVDSAGTSQTPNIDARTIKIPIYIIDSLTFNNFLNHFHQNKSKITIAPLFENSSLDLSAGSALYMYGLIKRRIDLGENEFEKIKETIKKTALDTTLIFSPFVISNSEIKVNELVAGLKGKKYDSLYFVPSIEKTLWDSLYHLNFTIYTNGVKTGNKFVLISKVAALNPCPPARPAEYNP